MLVSGELLSQKPDESASLNLEYFYSEILIHAETAGATAAPLLEPPAESLADSQRKAVWLDGGRLQRE